MEFLKKDIFYPNDGRYDDNAINAAREKYAAYLEEIRDKIPKNLMKYYVSEDRFHDYAIRQIIVSGNAFCYGAKSDKVNLELADGVYEITIEFDGISYLKIVNGEQESCWVDLIDCGASKDGLEEIVLCELGICKDNAIKFELLSSSGAIFEIRFKKIKIVKKTKKY